LRFHYNYSSSAISESLNRCPAHAKILTLGYIVRDIVLGFSTETTFECELSGSGLPRKLLPAALFGQSRLASAFSFGAAFSFGPTSGLA